MWVVSKDCLIVRKEKTDGGKVRRGLHLHNNPLFFPLALDKWCGAVVLGYIGSAGA
jgi:hypothetical protein